jgi:hypothetical protein
MELDQAVHPYKKLNKMHIKLKLAYKLTNKTIDSS